MPGHLIQDQDEFNGSVTQISDLIQSHDVIFLLTDSRESRWLPSLLGTYHDKLVITVALGFDSFLAMRHGNLGGSLGCYFCHDINSPSDTLSGRTLDQQCTVTRPGLSQQASATAVELLASILQHPLGKYAPATPCVSPSDPIPSESSMLGLVPHQVRGYLAHFQNMLLTGDRFECCPACSPAVLATYKSEGIEFIGKAIGQEDFLERASGLLQMKEDEAQKVAAYMKDLEVDDLDDF